MRISSSLGVYGQASRLREGEFLDQGDWTTLTIVDPSKVIKARQMSLEGTPLPPVGAKLQS